MTDVHSRVTCAREKFGWGQELRRKLAATPCIAQDLPERPFWVDSHRYGTTFPPPSPPKDTLGSRRGQESGDCYEGSGDTHWSTWETSGSRRGHGPESAARGLMSIGCKDILHPDADGGNGKEGLSAESLAAPSQREPERQLCELRPLVSDVSSSDHREGTR